MKCDERIKENYEKTTQKKDEKNENKIEVLLRTLVCV